ncbi:MAG: glycine cleavage system protein GcvH [Candidatus Aminicenantes bacterium]|nr:glycine cleavage system protein GcvH [Candidatus Aminicenantes bacterium]
MYPNNFRYTKDHEWVQVSGDEAVVGITDYAQNHLGDVVYVEVPAVGAKLAVHQVMGNIESVKAVSDVYSPLSGEVVAVNGGLNNSPELVNKDPHGQGWIARIKAANKSELDSLMNSVEYEKFLEGLDK